MSGNAPVGELSKGERRRRITLGMIRALGVSVALIAAYYLLPLSRLTDVPLAVSLVAGMAVLVIVASLQMRWVVQARHPGLRATEALATIAPLFLLIFAATYVVMARTEPGSFGDAALTRTDALYFTVTVFATVGFGDISPVSQGARLIVTVQMILDLLLLGVGVRVLLGAVDRGRQRPDDEPSEPDAAPRAEL